MRAFLTGSTGMTGGQHLNSNGLVVFGSALLSLTCEPPDIPRLWRSCPVLWGRCASCTHHRFNTITLNSHVVSLSHVNMYASHCDLPAMSKSYVSTGSSVTVMIHVANVVEVRTHIRQIGVAAQTYGAV